MHRQWPRLLYLITCALAALAGMVVSAAPEGAVAAVRVIDDAGRPLPARVTVTLTGAPTPDSHVLFTDPAGLCPLTGVPDGKATLQVNHGPQWRIISRAVTVDHAQGEVRELVLGRLYDLRARGYYEGDCHMHSTCSDGAQPPAEVAYHCRCEGLDWAFLTDHETVTGHAAFLATATPEFLPLPGQEVTTSQGHILALGVSRVVSRDVSHGAEDMKRIFGDIHAQGGIAVLAHPMTPTMNYRLWEVEGYDAIEILNGSLPPHSGLFDLVQARQKWHQLLGAGKRLPALGDSDNHDNTNGRVREALRDPQTALKREPRLSLLWNLPDRDKLLIPWALKGLYPGTYRTCLKLPALEAGAVLDALRAGRGFVTNGPVLCVTANGTDPGAPLTGPRAELCYEVACNRGLDHLTVLVNGKPIATVPLTGKETAEGTLKVDVGATGWLAVECYGTWPDFATTNAWYMTPQ